MHLPAAPLAAALIAAALIASPWAASADTALPKRLMKTIKADPDAYLQDVAALIAGSGQGDAITSEQVAVAVALERAHARVGAMAPLMAADLDGNGDISRDEMLAAATALRADGRARLNLAFVKADADGDAVVSGAELVALGDAAAMAAMGPARLAEVKVLMGFDADGDGRVTLAEVKTGVDAIVS